MPVDDDTEILIERASAGDERARDDLFARHRDRLRRMVAVRMDPRLGTRFDASDIVQEAFQEASRQLDDYLRQPQLPFYPWLRHIAWQRLVQLQRRHLYAQKRSVTREIGGGRYDLPDESMLQLAEQLVGSGTSPSRRMIRAELLEQVERAMEQLKDQDREILVLRHLEQLSVEQTAAVMNMTPGNVKIRHFRAVQRLQELLAS
jgi:RNA polymerase sigma-70 factor (ECF subfamily)